MNTNKNNSQPQPHDQNFFLQPIFLIITLQSMSKPIILLFKTQSQRNLIHIGLNFFIKQSKTFYSKLSQFDPFKAQSMMLFIQADKDGGNLLDIQESLDILNKLKINKDKIQVQGDVLEINKCLYQRQGLKRPKKSSDYQLTPLAFQYLLRYYSIKTQLTQYFKQYCPIFKIKTKNHKTTIIDIIKSYQKPQMSCGQLKLFYEEIFKHTIITEEQIQQIIMKFPIFDGEGKEKLDKNQEEMKLLGFNNFCNLLFSKQNNIIDRLTENQYNINKNKKINQQMNKKNNLNNNNNNLNNNTIPEKQKSKQSILSSKCSQSYLDHPITDYYIYTDLSFLNSKHSQKSNFFTSSIKRGCKCITIPISAIKSITSSISKSISSLKSINLIVPLTDKNTQLTMKNNNNNNNKNYLFLDQVLRDIKLYAFMKNNLPFWLVIDLNLLIIDNVNKFKNQQITQILLLLNQNLQDLLNDDIFLYHNSKFYHNNKIPTVKQLSHKIILVTNYNPKSTKTYKTYKNFQQDIKIPQQLQLKFTFTPVKLDFQRKGQSWRNMCFVYEDRIKNYQIAEQQNINIYSRNIMIFSQPKSISSTNYDPFPGFRQGIQFIGLNYQKNRSYNYLIHSKFTQNCQQLFGYLLKPQYLHSQNTNNLCTNKDFPRPIHKIHFGVLSAQKILINDLQPAPTSFYIQLIVKGSLHDQRNNSKSFKSSKKTQGFYTQFDLQCQLTVYNQDFFTILLLIKNSDNDKIIASKAITWNKMKEGLKSVELLGDRMQIGENSYLLVMYKIIQSYAKDQVARDQEKMKKTYKEFFK